MRQGAVDRASGWPNELTGRIVFDGVPAGIRQGVVRANIRFCKWLLCEERPTAVRTLTYHLHVDAAMPASLLTEIIFRPLFEIVLHVLGYLTGMVVVPLFTLGRYRIAPLLPEQRPRPRTRRQGHTPAQPDSISADDAALIGLLFWAVVAGAVALIWWLSK
jgi:hypothetical protein